MPGEEQPITLDSVSAHWRIAFNVAQDALLAVRACGSSLHFPESDLHELTTVLARQREATSRLLDQTAREEHLQLHHSLHVRRATKTMLGLPANALACIFDLDGVLTGSASVHIAAWAETLDEFLSRRVEETGERFAPYQPFDRRNDYFRYLQGKPRLEGIHAFLASRGIRIPAGSPRDPAGSETVYGLANRKNEAFLRYLEQDGVTAFAGSQRYLEDAHEAGLLCAVVSPSTSTVAILEQAGLEALVDQRIDGSTIASEELCSKPAPDTLLAACTRLGVTPEHAVAFETTFEGVAAARLAGFGFVVGVDRRARVELLPPHGADRVVTDLATLLGPSIP